MDIVYFGSDVFLSCFDYLTAHHTVRALYTYHNDEDYITEYSIVRRAAALGIPVHYEAVAPEVTRQYFRDGCDLYFVAEYDRIIEIPEDIPDFRGVNIHSSLLPEGRSYYPIEAAMERGLARTGVTVHRLMPRLDGGAILAQREIEITPDMDSIDVYLRSGAAARQMTEEILRDFPHSWESASPQREKLPYWKRPAPEKLTLTPDIDREQAAEVFRRFNSMTEVFLGERLYFVSALQTGPTPLPVPQLQLTETRWLYAVRDGHLRLSVFPKGANLP